MTTPYPPIAPFAQGLLRVSGGDEIYWETSGAPAGRPALWLHGGPGGTLGPGGYRRRFDPDRYLIVGIDQRGCGRSRPLVTDALDRIGDHTTQTLIADIEAVRAYLGIERWLVSGISWGTTLALAYGQRHPERVTEMVLAAVTTTSREEVDWITEGVGRLFPEAWHRFDVASERRPGERIVEAYARRLATGDADDRRRAARDWNTWEAVHVSLDPLWTPGVAFDNEESATVFATTVTHYWANDGFLRDDAAILTRMDKIADIPAALIHGRRDVSGPAVTPWRLHCRWPASRLVIVEHEGHGGPAMMEEARLVLDGFTARLSSQPPQSRFDRNVRLPPAG